MGDGNGRKMGGKAGGKGQWSVATILNLWYFSGYVDTSVLGTYHYTSICDSNMVTLGIDPKASHAERMSYRYTMFPHTALI